MEDGEQLLEFLSRVAQVFVVVELRFVRPLKIWVILEPLQILLILRQAQDQFVRKHFSKLWVWEGAAVRGVVKEYVVAVVEQEMVEEEGFASRCV